MGRAMAFRSARSDPVRSPLHVHGGHEPQAKVRVARMYNLNERHISPAALLRPDDLFSRIHREARTAAILRDKRLQLATDEAGEPAARVVAG